eukprot:scaffold155_cov347-Pavlova_lutheri.AAC.86
MVACCAFAMMKGCLYRLPRCCNETAWQGFLFVADTQGLDPADKSCSRSLRRIQTEPLGRGSDPRPHPSSSKVAPPSPSVDRFPYRLLPPLHHPSRRSPWVWMVGNFTTVDSSPVRLSAMVPPPVAFLRVFFGASRTTLRAHEAIEGVERG